MKWTPKVDGGLLSFWRQNVRKRGSIQDGKTPCRSGMSGEKKENYDVKRKIEEMHQRKVSKMIKRAEGGAGLVHKISTPTARRGGPRC